MKTPFNVRLLSLMIIGIPLFEPYSLSGISLDTILFLGCVIYGFITCPNNCKPKLYSVNAFFIYAFTIPNLIALFYGYSNHIISSIIVLTLYLLCILKVFPQIRFSYMLSKYRLIVYFVCGIFVVQELMYMILGFRFSAMIPFLPLKYEGLSMSSFIKYQMSYERSSSLFLEPSHMAQFIIPYLAIKLGETKKVFNLASYIEPLILTGVLFFLRSGCGVIGALVIWGFFFLQIKLSVVKKTFFILIGIVISIFAYSQLSSTEIGKSLSIRSTEFDEGASYERSGVIRVTRGFLVYGAENEILQILGVGTGGTIDVIEDSPYKFMFFGNERYLNNVQMLLVGFGLIGSFLFLIHLYNLYSKNTLSARLVLWSFLGISFLESFFFNSKMALYMSFVFTNRQLVDYIVRINPINKLLLKSQ